MTNLMTYAYNRLSDEDRKLADKVTKAILEDPQTVPPEFDKIFWENWRSLLA